MDTKDVRNTQHPEFITPNQNIGGKVEAGQPEQIQTSETADLETAGVTVAEQQAPLVAVPSISPRPAEAMTAQELTDLGLDASIAGAQTPDRQKVLLNALIETKVEPNSNQGGTQANELQDLAFGLEESKE